MGTFREAGVADSTRLEYAAAVREAIADRAPLAALLFVAFIGVGSLFELPGHPERHTAFGALYGIEAVLCLVYVAASRRRRDAALQLSITLAVLLALCISTYFALIGDNNELLVIALVILLTGFQVLFPWGLSGQLALAGGAFAGLLLNLASGTSGSLPPAEAVFSLVTAAALSSLGASLLDQHRFDAFRRTLQLQRANAIQRQEADISAALLRVSATLDNALTDPTAMIQQLTELLPDILGVEWALTHVWDDGRLVYRLGASAGIGVEGSILAELQSMEFSRDSLPLIDALEREGMIEIADRDEQTLIPAGILERWKARSVLSAAIRRGRAPVGVLTVGYEKRAGPFNPAQIRLLGGICQQAAVALENSRLMEATLTANRVKSEFVAAMSHELRTPLNVILGYIDLFDEGHLGDVAGEQKDALSRMRQRSLQLLELITTTLDLNRLEGGQAILQLENFSIGELFAALRESIPPQWQKSGVSLGWDDRCTRVLMRGDRTKLETALRNLIHNALKYTDAGEVRVSALATADGKGIEFQVSDTGIGIAPDQMPHVFDMFRQADGVAARDGGVGLGLYIVKRLAEAIGATLLAESTPGKGSQFTMRLPLHGPTGGQRLTGE